MTALITGASSGIGWELAKLFAQNGYDLVLSARNEAKLNELAADLAARYGVKCRVLVQDLAQPQAPREIFGQLQREAISIDVLINNAGFGSWGRFDQADLQQQMDMLQVNIAALTHLTRLFLPEMVQRDSGKIMNVASTAAFQPGPMTAVYYASKAYVLSFTEALASELQGTGVMVTAFCPGLTRTNFHRRAGLENIGLQRLMLMEAPQAARLAYRGLTRNRRVVVPGWQNKLVPIVNRLLPRRWVTDTVRKLQLKREKK